MLTHDDKQWILENVATKRDLQETKEELRCEMQETKEELRSEMQEMKGELRCEMQGMREGLCERMDGIAEELRRLKDDIFVLRGVAESHGVRLKELEERVF